MILYKTWKILVEAQFPLKSMISYPPHSQCFSILFIDNWSTVAWIKADAMLRYNTEKKKEKETKLLIWHN